VSGNVRAGDHDELILPFPGDQLGGTGLFKAYAPATGEELWRCEGLGNEIYAMPVVSAEGDLLVGISGFRGPTLAVRLGGRGDVTQTHRLWHTPKNPQRIGSGVLHKGYLYLSDADGFLECLEARTGKNIWKERLGGTLWGSLLLAGDRIYVSNLEGLTFVVAANPKFQVLARNDLSEPTYAALAVSNGELFLRTHQHLYCISVAK